MDFKGKHISQQFDDELEDLRNKVMEMGGLVEQQIADSISALKHNDTALAEKVEQQDHKVNAMEVEIDEECTTVIARRQPAASDLRMVIAIIKTITDLERIGDEAERVARLTHKTADKSFSDKSIMASIEQMATMALALLHQALDTFARLDSNNALSVIQSDEDIDSMYQGIMRQLTTYVMEDPRNYSSMMETGMVARSIERIGDHAKNICEYVIYLVEGKDIRHTDIDKLY